MTSEEMEDSLPSLAGKGVPKCEKCKDWVIVYKVPDVVEYCVDRQRLKELLNTLEQEIMKHPDSSQEGFFAKGMALFPIVKIRERLQL